MMASPGGEGCQTQALFQSARTASSSPDRPRHPTGSVRLARGRQCQLRREGLVFVRKQICMGFRPWCGTWAKDLKRDQLITSLRSSLPSGIRAAGCFIRLSPRIRTRSGSRSFSGTLNLPADPPPNGCYLLVMRGQPAAGRPVTPGSEGSGTGGEGSGTCSNCWFLPCLCVLITCCRICPSGEMRLTRAQWIRVTVVFISAGLLGILLAVVSASRDGTGPVGRSQEVITCRDC